MLSACASPAVYGRTADVQPPGYARVGPRTNLAIAPTSVRVEQDPTEPRSVWGTPDGTYHDYVVGYRTNDFGSDTHLAFGWLGSLQIEFGVGLFEPCELGGALGFAHMGVEARCALRRGGEGELSFAASTGVAHQLREPPGSVEWRGGVDMSLRAGWARPFLDAYLARAPALRSVAVPGGPDFEVDEYRLLVDVERDEWLLAVPIGVALVRASRGGEGRFIVAVQPEFMLHSAVRRPPEEPFVASISQYWAIYFTVGGELAFDGRPPPPVEESDDEPARSPTSAGSGVFDSEFQRLGCVGDDQCKGDRICVDGACRWPSSPAPPPSR